MRFDPTTTPDRDFYFAMIHCIAPRPIAWVSTLDAQGRENLAPFSFFSGVTSEPPTLLFCPGYKSDGSPKDTLSNIEATKEFVVNVVPFKFSETMNATSAELDHGISEFEHCNVEMTPSERVRPPRVKGCPAAFECKLRELVRVGSGNVVIGDILLLHVADDVLDGSGAIKPERLDLIGRMGGMGYCRTTERFDMRRPR